MKTLTCNIHLLPTDKDSHLYLAHDKKLGWVTGKHPEDLEQFPFQSGTKNQHLYFTIPQQEGVEISKIKHGDWYLNGKHLYQADRHYEIAEFDEKIIATTNRELKVKGEQAGENAWFYHLPSIPEAFMQYFIEQYNKGNIIKTVEAKTFWRFNYKTRCLFDDILEDAKGLSIVMPTVNKERLYTREEIINISRKAFDDSCKYNSFEDFINTEI